MASTEEGSPATGADEALLDERDLEPRTPMKRLGSTRKLAAFNNIRLQLCEQTRVLEARAEAVGGVAGELHEYCRRRADVEHEYSRALDKLARGAAARHRERAEPLGATGAWRAQLDGTRALARDHAALAALYGGPLAARLARAADDAQRLHRKCRDLLLERHEEVAAALAAAQARGKAHAAAHAAWRHAALKLRAALDARADPPKHKKAKALDKEVDKRRARHGEARATALRARAEYALALDAANATLQRYYLDDVADVMVCTELGFEACVARCVRTAAAAEEARAAAAGGAGVAGALRAAAAALDALADRQRVLEAHAAAFALPRPLAPPPPEEAQAVAELVAGEAEGAPEAAVRADLELRLRQLEAAARALRAECRENAKTLDAAEDELLKQMEGSDSQWDVSGVFGSEGGGASAVPAPPVPPGDDQEDYYLAKFRAYVACAGRLARVESKAAALRGRLGAGGGGAAVAVPARAVRRHRGQFCAPLEQVRLPRVLTECVRVIAAHGLRHQGLFRVSGSHAEIAALRAAFERGEEPLARAGPPDLNSVCGLLKLWVREVRPPLLPPQLQERLLRVAALPDEGAFCSRLRATLSALPLPAVLVLRYLFAFLAHVAAHAHYNMMDAWNLAVCLGPTLLAAWGDPPHQLAAQNLVNELVKRTILLHERVFPQDVAPHALYMRAGEEQQEEEEEEEDRSAEAAAAAAEAAAECAALGELDEPDARDTLDRTTDDSDTDEDTSDECDAPAADSRRASVEPRQVPRELAVPPEPASASPPASAQPSATHRRLAESTPDLVLDLPARPPPPAEPAPPASPAPPSPPAAAAADVFVHNRDTLRKRHACSAGSEAEAEVVEGGGGGGSPVPARNTARVAAKFAELTLTGGSLKPALAAKPALLRRPTPHPHHAHHPTTAPPAQPPAQPDPPAP